MCFSLRVSPVLSVDKEDPAEVQTVSQKQLDEKLDEKLNGLEQRLMNKLDTANAGCKCTIA